MSKIGKKLVMIPKGVEVKHTDAALEFKGKEGTLVVPVLPSIDVHLEGEQLSFTTKDPNLQAQANWGTMRALSQNAVIGVHEGFKKILEILGVGFRANMEGNILVLNIGFSHPVRFTPTAGVKIVTEKNVITVSGLDKYLVGENAAKIRALKKPEPYKGTGIRYRGEVVRKKAGKKVAGATGAAA